MTEEELKYFIDTWIVQSEDTNDYCTRSLIVEALKAAEEGDAKEAALILRQVVPPSLGISARVVDRPRFITKYRLEEE